MGGNESSVQAAIFVPDPKRECQFYLFTSQYYDGVTNYTSSGSQLNISTQHVDKPIVWSRFRLDGFDNNGKSLITYNQNELAQVDFTESYDAREKLYAYERKVGNDKKYFVLTVGDGTGFSQLSSQAKFYVATLDANTDKPIFRPVNVQVPTNTTFRFAPNNGRIKVSPDGSKCAVILGKTASIFSIHYNLTTNDIDHFELLNVISSQYTSSNTSLFYSNGYYWFNGGEFSTNGDFLYISHIYGIIEQVDLRQGNNFQRREIWRIPSTIGYPIAYPQSGGPLNVLSSINKIPGQNRLVVYNLKTNNPTQNMGVIENINNEFGTTNGATYNENGIIINGIAGHYTFPNQMYNGAEFNCNVCNINLVENGDFERLKTTNEFCTSPGSESTINVANFLTFDYLYNWNTVSGSVDYYRKNNNNNQVSINANVPCNFFGYQDDGIVGNKAYLGFIPSRFNYWNEIFHQRLNGDIEPNKTYKFSFDLSVAENCYAYRIPDIELFLTNQPVIVSNQRIVGAENNDLNKILRKINVFDNTNFQNSNNVSSNNWKNYTIFFQTSSDIQPNINDMYIGIVKESENIPPVEVGNIDNVNLNSNNKWNSGILCPNVIPYHSWTQSNVGADVGGDHFVYYYIDNIRLVESCEPNCTVTCCPTLFSSGSTAGGGAIAHPEAIRSLFVTQPIAGNAQQYKLTMNASNTANFYIQIRKFMELIQKEYCEEISSVRVEWRIYDTNNTTNASDDLPILYNGSPIVSSTFPYNASSYTNNPNVGLLPFILEYGKEYKMELNISGTTTNGEIPITFPNCPNNYITIKELK